MKKLPKIKIPSQDLAAFGMDKLIVDPYWHDLYGIASITSCIELEEEEEEEY